MPRSFLVKKKRKSDGSPTSTSVDESSPRDEVKMFHPVDARRDVLQHQLVTLRVSTERSVTPASETSETTSWWSSDIEDRRFVHDDVSNDDESDEYVNGVVRDVNDVEHDIGNVNDECRRPGVKGKMASFYTTLTSSYINTNATIVIVMKDDVLVKLFYKL